MTDDAKSYEIELLNEDVEYLQDIKGYDWKKRIRNIVHRFCLESRKDWNNDRRSRVIEECARVALEATNKDHPVGIDEVCAAIRALKDKP